MINNIVQIETLSFSYFLIYSKNSTANILFLTSVFDL